MQVRRGCRRRQGHGWCWPAWSPRQGLQMPPKRPGHFPRREHRLWGPLRAAFCPFVQCWLQEFLDPLPDLGAGRPLKVPGEGFGSSARTRPQLLGMCLWGGKALFKWAGRFPGSPPTPVAQPDLLTTQRSCTPAWGQMQNEVKCSGRVHGGEHCTRAASAPGECPQAFTRHQAARAAGRPTAQRRSSWPLTPRALGASCLRPQADLLPLPPPLPYCTIPGGSSSTRNPVVRGNYCASRLPASGTRQRPPRPLPAPAWAAPYPRHRNVLKPGSALLVRQHGQWGRQAVGRVCKEKPWAFPPG